MVASFALVFCVAGVAGVAGLLHTLNGLQCTCRVTSASLHCHIPNLSLAEQVQIIPCSPQIILPFLLLPASLPSKTCGLPNIHGTNSTRDAGASSAMSTVHPLGAAFPISARALP